MRVLVLNASPKGEQSHTMAITRAFLSGFPEGTQTELLELRHLNIRPCTGCLGCWTKTPGRCVQRDDMDRVYAAIAAADVIVESFPLYFYGIPGTLKTLTDRCLPYMQPVTGHQVFIRQDGLQLCHRFIFHKQRCLHIHTKCIMRQQRIVFYFLHLQSNQSLRSSNCISFHRPCRRSK